MLDLNSYLRDYMLYFNRFKGTVYKLSINVKGTMGEISINVKGTVRAILIIFKGTV